MNVDTSKYIDDIRNNFNNIISKWLGSFDNKDAEYKIGNVDAGSFRAFLQLLLTHFESPDYTDHIPFLSQIIASQLSAGIEPRAIVTALDLLKTEVVAAVKDRKSRGEFEPVISKAFLEWMVCVSEEYAKHIARPLDEKISELQRWEKAAIANIPLPLILLSTDCTIQRVSWAWLRITGNVEDDVLGVSVGEIYGKKFESDLESIFAVQTRPAEIDAKTVGKCERLPSSLVYLWIPVIENSEIAGAMIVASSSRRIFSPVGPENTFDLNQQEIPEFGQMLKKIRRDQNIALVDLARKVELARGFLSMVENGKARPSFKTVQKLADILDPDSSKELLLLGVLALIPPDIRVKLPWP